MSTEANKMLAVVDGWLAAKKRVDAAFAAVDAATRRPFGRAPKSAMLEMSRAVRGLTRATDKWLARNTAKCCCDADLTARGLHRGACPRLGPPAPEPEDLVTCSQCSMVLPREPAPMDECECGGDFS